jgi:hypothetical protein
MNNIELKDLVKITNKICGIDIENKTRKRYYVFCRTLYYGLARTYTTHCLDDIGKEIRKDHSTVLFALKNLERDVIKNKQHDLNIKWERANIMLKQPSDITDELLNAQKMRSELIRLTEENNKRLEELKKHKHIEISKKEKRLLELFKMLSEEDKNFLILKAEATIKMKQDELRRKEEQNKRLEGRKVGFSSYLADAEV